MIEAEGLNATIRFGKTGNSAGSSGRAQRKEVINFTKFNSGLLANFPGHNSIALFFKIIPDNFKYRLVFSLNCSIPSDFAMRAATSSFHSDGSERNLSPSTSKLFLRSKVSPQQFQCFIFG